MISSTKVTKILSIITLIALSSCASMKNAAVQRDIKKIIRQSPVFSKYFVGFSLYDPISKQTLSAFNEDKYFTPASNTKIVTLASYLNLRLNRIPSFRISMSESSPSIAAMGDPTFLHPDFEIQPAYDYLRKLDTDTLIVVPPLYPIDPFGPGWAWDDYSYYFQPERSWFPIYGNVIDINIENNDFEVVPAFFADYIDFNADARSRDRNHNLFNFPLDDYLGDTTNIDLPFTISEELIETLLTDTLQKDILISTPVSVKDWSIVYGPETTPVLSLMMQRSDNFLAEQLLVNAQRYEGYADQETYIEYLNSTLFADLPDPLIWEDGSGLSRYNMNTPRNQVKILEKIYEIIDWDDITTIFPTGGVSGTIRNWYAADDPYVYAKTGTLRHNHCLSGYLVTKSGRKLIFSFMNNHYTVSSSEVKAAMQSLLEQLRDKY